jgi:hypothetical protein
MECGSYAGRCVFVMGAKEGPTRDLHRPTQEASLSVRVGRRKDTSPPWPIQARGILALLHGPSLCEVISTKKAPLLRILYSCGNAPGYAIEPSLNHFLMQWMDESGRVYLPARSPGDDRPLPLGVSMWFTHAHDPRELCREEARGAR